ncbi:MAG: GH3 auxin-responsive promoter [Pseudozobellia sp.]|nr:GH3 auxin-responsive promoter [Pseudozobellia sp.]MBG47842.1 GH3 auxin-responsive promoter [Pseudozobellia sp.]|tara:strand:- start:419660 stop:421186 length:1527 start_codon:yes stop_codon:yes gene_type:complete
MPIIGNIIKGFIEVRDKLSGERNPIDEQKQVLKKLLTEANETAFGEHYDFNDILESEDIAKAYSKKIPFHDYNKINDEWWHQLHEGKTDVTWPGKPHYFALSSGTTGNTSKRIPVTDEMVSAIRNAGIQQVYALSNFDLPADFFEKDILMLGSSTDLEKVDDHEEGEISGISASNIPNWFRGYYKPGEDIAEIDDWDERVAKIAEKAESWDVGALSGIPSWIELMLEKVIEHHNLKNIHDLWPNLQVYTSGGVAFGPYEKSFNALLGHPITIIDTYLASEGFVAFQARPETDAMQLVTDGGIYFEFVPFKPEYINQDGSLVDDAPSITLGEVQKGQDYVLIISTVSGAWRYIIGDTIEFTDVERAEIKITGRTKFFLNTVGSQLSVNKLDDAVQHLEEKFSMKIPEYTLCANRIDEEFYHCWYLGSEDAKDGSTLAEALDEHLKQANKNYKVARSKALKGVKVTVVKPDAFHEWNGENKKKGGQVKMEKVMNEEKFAQWQAFVKENGY